MKTINSLRSKLLALTLALMASVSSFAYDEMPDFQVDGLYYNFLEGDNVEVTHPYRPEMPTEGTSTTATQDLYDDYAELTELTIPSTISYEGKVYNVIRIGYAAFDQCNLTYVDIPSSIKTIGVGAFSNCSSLTSITLKEGLEHIEGNAFADCRLLETITFPNSLKTVGSYAFSFTAWYNNQPNGGVYAGNVFYKYKGDIPENTSFVIKEGTVSISPDAFIKENRRIDYGLVAVAIPNSVEIIGEYAFSQCRALRSVNIPSRVTTIESYAFSYCKSLTSVTSEIVEPLSLPSDVFFKASVANATLYVPAESVEAYKSANQWKDFGQILPIKPLTAEDLFPTLWGLQRTEVEYHTDGADAPSLVSFEEYTPTLVNGKWYLYDGRNYLREENNQVLLYSPEFEIYEDVVLYDWTLEIGDTLPFTIRPFDDDKMRGAVFRVTDVSTITLLDGKEYKKWTLACGIEYIEGIGAINGEGFGNYFCIQHTAHPATYIDTRLVCASRNGQLLYQMDEAEMERLGTECLCEIETSYKSQWCDTWNIFVENGSVYPPHEETYRYQLAKDTVIGEHTYTAVVSKAINDAFDAPRYVAAIRFTDDRKVYIYYDNAEYLLYDFNVQEGDELEVFAGINNYTSEIKTYKCTVTGVEQYACVGCPAAITLEVHNHPDDFREFYRQTQWIEGVGDINGFLNGLNGYINIPGNAEESLLCAYKGDELKYTGPLYEKYGCEYNANDPLPLYPWCNQWNILAHGYLGPQEPLYGAKTTIYQLGGDTIINHLRYQQLTRYASDDTNQTKTYVGAIRFTKNNRQVYFYYDNAEYLLYDFKAQIGDTLEVFAGIDNYRDNKTYKHVVTNKEPIQDEQCKVTLDVFVSLELEGEIIHEEKFTTTWIEGVGSPDGIVHNCATLREGNFVTDVLCAYVDDRRMYRTPYPDYRILGCEYNDGDFIEGAFPILSGLQRTVCKEYYGETEDDNSANSTYKQTFDQIFFENDKPYILCNDYLLREEDNKILIYSQTLNKDLVLYDFTLEVGDSLLALYINAPQWDPPQSEDIIIVTPPYNGYVVDHDYNGKPDPVVVTDISTVTLLDGKEYKKWTFDNGMEYVEGIGSFGNRQWSGDFFQLIANRDVPTSLQGEHLVCVSKNNKLLYQMDNEEMERLGTECLCAQPGKGETDDAKDGQIGGRPTPTQWYIVEINQEVIHKLPAQRSDENNSSILSAETYIYTLENDSLRVNGKKYFELDRYSSKNSPDTKVNVGALHFGQDDKVWFYHDNTEYLLYDFSAEVGDTLQLFAGIHNYPTDSVYTHVVTAKDTIEDGITRVTLDAILYEQVNGQQTELHYEKVWLAGLGSIDGIVHNSAKRASKARNNIEQNHVMLCAWRDDDCLYTTNHPDYNSYGCVYNQDPTAVDNIPTSHLYYHKILCGDQLLIIRDGKIYNVIGQEILSIPL